MSDAAVGWIIRKLYELPDGSGPFPAALSVRSVISAAKFWNVASKVFEGIGLDTGAGLAKSLDASERLVASAAVRLAQVTSMDFSPTPRGAGLPSLDALPTPRGVAATAAGNNRPVIEFRGDGAIIELIRKTVRTEGGDVQLVFGR